MANINKKLRLMSAAAAMLLMMFPVSCGSEDNGKNDAGNGVNSDSIYDNSPENDGEQTILDNAADSINDGLNSVMSDIDGIDDGMTNSTSTTTANDKSRMGTVKNNSRMGGTTHK